MCNIYKAIRSQCSVGRIVERPIEHKEEDNKSFTNYLTRQRKKLGRMRHRPTEADQLTITMMGYVLALSKKLGDLGIRNFEELDRFGVQKESDLE